MTNFMAPPLKEKKAEDNLRYEDNKKIKLLDTFAGKVNRLMNMGAGADLEDLQFLLIGYLYLYYFDLWSCFLGKFLSYYQLLLFHDSVFQNKSIENIFPQL